MKNRINLIAVIGGGVLILGLYTAFLLILGDMKHTTLWVGYGFTVFAFCLSGAIIWLMRINPLDAKEYFYQIPITAVCSGYLVITMVLGGIVSAFSDDSIKWVILAEAAVLVLFILLCGVFALQNRKTIDTMKETDQSIAQIRSMESGLMTIARSCTDKTLAGKIFRLAEDVRFSAPSNNPRIVALDASFFQMQNDLQTQINNGNYTEAETIVEHMVIHLKSRNQECKIKPFVE